MRSAGNTLSNKAVISFSSWIPPSKQASKQICNEMWVRESYYEEIKRKQGNKIGGGGIYDFELIKQDIYENVVFWKISECNEAVKQGLS